MRNKIQLLLALIFIIGLVVFQTQGQRPNATKSVWEYQIVNGAVSQEELNSLGAQGWEMVLFDAGVRPGNSDAGQRYYFKRRK